MAQKLLLLQDVEAIGRSGDVVNVRPGFARNFLLPRGIAVTADKNALRMQARLQEERKKQAAIDKKEAEEQAGMLSDKALSTIVKVDQEGHMYGSVSALDIVALLKDQIGMVLERRSVQVPHPIRETGVHTIKLKLKEGVATSIVLKIIPEEPHGGEVKAEAKREAKGEHKAEAKAEGKAEKKKTGEGRRSKKEKEQE